MEETSNRNLVVLLVILVAVFLILLGVWFWGGFSFRDGSSATMTVTRRPLTEAERDAIVAQNRAVMLQFATTSPVNPTVLEKEKQANLKIMESFQRPGVTISAEERKENYRIMKLFQ